MFLPIRIRVAKVATFVDVCFLIESRRKISRGGQRTEFRAEKSPFLSEGTSRRVVAELHERLSPVRGSECGLSLDRPRGELPLRRHVVLPIRRPLLTAPHCSSPSYGFHPGALARTRSPIIITTTPYYVSSINRECASDRRDGSVWYAIDHE